MIRGRIASYLMGLSIVFVITLCGASAVSAQPQNPITSMIETERNDGAITQ